MTRAAVVATVVVLAALPAFPAVFGSYGVTLFTLIFFYGFLGQAWNIVGGYAGQLSAGHAAFLGLGAYTTAVLAAETGLTPWIGMLVGGAVAAVLGAVVGFLGFRFGLRGFYFVLLTVAFAEICRIVAANTEAVGGAVGYYITFTGDPRYFQFQDARAYYYVALVLMLAATALVAVLEGRRFGRYLAAIRDDETAAEAAGVNTLRYKMSAMVLSSFVTGVGGAFYAYYLFSLQPNTVFGIPLSVEMIVRAVVGGAGTVLGPVLGSFLLSPLAELARHYFAQGGWHGAHLVVYGVLLISVVLFLPEGAYPRLARTLGRGRIAAPPAPAGPPAPVAPVSAARARGATLLDARGLSKRFGGVQAVASVDLAVAEGEILGLIGPNGAGKTTVFNLLSGFLVPDAGSVRFRGAPIVGRPPHAICRAGMARTFQIVRPFPRLTVLDNVLVGALARHPDAAEARARARAVVERVGLGAKVLSPAAGLTLAERKRLELARALATDPALLLLDEVMAGLNPTEVATLVGLLRDIHAGGVAVLLIEHNMRAVMSLSQRVVVLNFGETIAVGTAEAIARHPRVVEAYLGEEEAPGAPA